jgi:hypothetical protein
MLNILKNVGLVPYNGFGWLSFNLHYSQWQSSYFKTHQSQNIYSVVADCPLFAFNEIMHFYVEFGILAPVVFLFFWIANIRLLLAKISDKKKHYALGSVIILIFSLVSYPFHSIWVFLIFTTLQLLIYSSRYKLPAFSFFIIIGMGSAVSGFYYNRYIESKANWVEAQMIPFSQKKEKRNAYEALVSDLYTNPYFMKGYVDYLLDEGLIIDAKKILFRYEKYFIRYDFLMSFGKLFLMENNMEKASFYYAEAHYLIPNRFTPLVFLMRIASDEKDEQKARNYAIQIVNLDEKIPSSTTASIKAEARELIKLK